MSATFGSAYSWRMSPATPTTVRQGPGVSPPWVPAPRLGPDGPAPAGRGHKRLASDSLTTATAAAAAAVSPGVSSRPLLHRNPPTPRNTLASDLHRPGLHAFTDSAVGFDHLRGQIEEVLAQLENTTGAPAVAVSRSAN